MLSSEVIKSIHQRKALLEEYGVKSVDVFGSVARDEAKEGSDVDLLVDFEKPVSLFKFLRLKTKLEEALGCKVDMVTRAALKPQLRDRILGELVHVV